METQVDYETELTLAVFRSGAEANEGIKRVRAIGVPAQAIGRESLAPGRYVVEDSELREGTAGARAGALFGAAIGAAVGLGVTEIASGAARATAPGLAVACAAVGALFGGFVGSIVRAHFDDDVARMLALPPSEPGVLVVVHSGGGLGTETAHLRAALAGAGAIGFLDAGMFDAASVPSRA